MTLTVHEVIGVRTILCIVGQQGVTRDLLVEAPVRIQEVQQVLDFQK